ncbi:MAG: radical SAM protein [Gammaproteobacteria bacterium]|nr:radical SAM protein [Gammaproteobacteria bacterium]
MNDVVLVIPPYHYKTKVLTSSVKEYAGMGFLAAVLRQHGHSVEILDCDLAGFDIDETVEVIIDRNAPLIGLTMLQVAAYPTLEIVRRLRQRGVTAHITLGGHFPSFTVDELLSREDGVDSIVIGEGEYTLLELTRAILAGDEWREISGVAYWRDGESITTEPRPLVKDLDSLPFQERDTLREVLERGGQAAIITSRGCYGNCAFCSVNAFYKKSPGLKWRARSPENVGEELEHLVKTWGASIFVFNDDNFIGPGKGGKDRAARVAEEILHRGLNIQFAIPAAVNDVEPELFGLLKKAGLRSVFLGVESMNQEDLKYLNKHTTIEQNETAIGILEELGIFYQIGFIMFYPNSTIEQVEYNIRYVKDNIVNNDYCGTQVFTGELRILHGTSLHDRLAGEPFVHEDLFHYTYSMEDSRVEELRYLMDHLILKKTFPLMVDCKEEFMGASPKRIIRAMICDLQLSMALRAVSYLKKEGTVTPKAIKAIIREMNQGAERIQREGQRRGWVEAEMQ